MSMQAGLFIPQGWRFDLVGIPPHQQWDAMANLVRWADNGAMWSSVWVYDHFHTFPEPSEEATHEAWSLISAFAAISSRVRLGQMCTCMAYRNPVYLAKVAATADIISGGRVEMGIGAGWYEHEWRAYGYGFPRAGQRLAMLREGVDILSQAWRTGKATFHGEHYDVDGALIHPRPLQPDGLPLWIAGGGEKVTLKIAAQYAQYTNFDGGPEGFAHKSEVLANHCRDLGRDFESITRSANYNVAVGADESEVADRLRVFRERMARHVGEQRADDAVESLRNSLACGTPEQIVERLRAMVDRGMTYGIFYFPEAAYDTSGIDLFTHEVLPELTAPELPLSVLESDETIPPRPEEVIADEFRAAPDPRR